MSARHREAAMELTVKSLESRARKVNLNLRLTKTFKGGGIRTQFVLEILHQAGTGRKPQTG